ncbi:hypothetical protein ONZ45_g328 [Pleurotus djamor]|nr:hypothetical protein ONZ45_g328 [Pleurotus djamor]
MIVPGKLELKEGAQVMLVKNVESEIGLVNGCVGRVAGFARVCDVIGAVAGDDDGKAIIRGVVVGDDGKPVLRGIKDEDKENKKEDTHANPVKSEGSKSKPPSSAAKGKKKARQVDETLYPVVTFPITPLPPPPPPTPSSSSTSMVPPPPPGPTTETLLLLPDEFRIEDNEGTLLCRRLQIPLVLAWAMSIHKSQGQTIAKVRVDLGRCFEKGQCYVAVSRAVGVEGLQVVGFDPKKVGPHEKVVKWYKELKEERGRMKSGGESVEAELIDADVETAAQ